MCHIVLLQLEFAFPGSDGKESACGVGDPGLILGSRRSPGKENGNPPQDSCLGNPIDRGAWQPLVHEVTKGWTQLKQSKQAVC